MKIFILTIILGATFQLSSAFAHPPSEMNLNYIHEEELLRVEMTHVSHDIRDHYIRKIYVFKNDEKSALVYLTRQNSPKIAIEDISIKADSEDVIRVKVFCSTGGAKEETVIVPELKIEEEEVK